MKANYEALISTILKADSDRMEILRAVRSLDLDDWCIAAGFVRNSVWDYLHQYSCPTHLNDIDVCYYNAQNLNSDVDRALERRLNLSFPGKCWAVKNQARMHIKNNCAQYKNTEDAMRYWPEIQTAIGVSTNLSDDIKIHSIYPLERLFSLSIERNANCLSRDVFLKRINEKRWLEIWPKLKVFDARMYAKANY